MKFGNILKSMVWIFCAASMAAGYVHADGEAPNQLSAFDLLTQEHIYPQTQDNNKAVRALASMDKDAFKRSPEVRNLLHKLPRDRQVYYIHLIHEIGDRKTEKPDLVNQFILNAMNFEVQAKQPLLSSNIDACSKTSLNDKAFATFAALVDSAKSAKSPKEAYQAMVLRGWYASKDKKAQQPLFKGNNEQEVKTRICGLARSECAVLGDSIRQVCDQEELADLNKRSKVEEQIADGGQAKAEKLDVDGGTSIAQHEVLDAGVTQPVAAKR